MAEGLKCHSCGAQARRLIYGKDRFGCDRCYTAEDCSSALRHSSYLPKGFKRLTYAEAMRIKTNKLRADGQYSPDPQWRSSRPDWGDGV